MSLDYEERREALNALNKRDSISQVVANVLHRREEINANNQHLLDGFGIEVGKGYEDDRDFSLKDIPLGKNSDYSVAMSNILADSLAGASASITNDGTIGAVGLQMVEQQFKEHVDSDGYLSDGINGLEGHEIIPLGIILNWYMYINAPIPQLVDMIVPQKTSNKWRTYSIKQQVQRGAGALVAGEPLNATNNGKPLAIKARHRRFVYRTADSVGGVATYNYKLYQRDSDIDTTPIPINKTKVTFLRKDLSIDDFGIKNISTSCSPSAQLNGANLELSILYSGEINVKISDGALNDGDVFVVETQVNIDNLEEDRGMVELDIDYADYPSYAFSIGTRVDAFDEDIVKTHLGFGLLDANTMAFMNKTAGEIQQFALQKAEFTAQIWGKALDLSTAIVDSNKDIYDHLIAEVKAIGIEMTTKSGLGTKPFVFGDVNLSRMIELSDSMSIETKLNGIRPVGILGNSFNAYYDPLHDVKYPMVDKDGVINIDTSLNVYNQLLVIGGAIVTGGFPRPARNEKIDINENSERWTAFEGEFMCALKEDKAYHELAYILLYRTV